VIRAVVPPCRIRDVFVVVPAPQGPAVQEARRLLSQITQAAASREADRRGNPEQDLFIAKAFDPIGYGGSSFPNARTIAPGVLLVPGTAVETEITIDEPLEPSSRAGIGWASVAVLVVLGLAGYGWARIGIDDVLTAAAAAPAVGGAMLIVAGVALDILGIPIGETPGAIATLALGGGCGYLARLILERRVRTRPAPEVEEQPTE
jgi:hypothetical protein